MKLKCDAVFEGGGVRGIGHIGAASAIEQAGYTFENIAGSSAGAIVGSLLAAGYSTNEIYKEMEMLDYKKFQQSTNVKHFGILGSLLNLIFKFGIYDTQYIEEWLGELLMKKGKKTFKDIKVKNPSLKKYTYKLQVTASDLTAHRLLTLPEDLELFGIDKDSFSIARAVRMSMSIPLFYKPFVLFDLSGKPHYIVDGSLLSNYPVWILDDGTKNPPFPTFGFKFFDDERMREGQYDSCIDLITYLKNIFETLTSSQDKMHISRSKGDYQRSILIPVGVNVNGHVETIKTVNFNINQEESLAMFKNGYSAAVRFLSTWDFDSWVKTYRR